MYKLMCDLKKKKLFKRGFSLAEVVIAVALLGVIIVIISGVFVRGLHAIKKSRYRVVAVNISDKKCSELRYLFLNTITPISRGEIADSIYGAESVDNDFDWGTLVSPAPPVHIEGKETVDNIEYSFIIEISDEGTVDGLKEVEIKMVWPEVEGERSFNVSTLLSSPSVAPLP